MIVITRAEKDLIRRYYPGVHIRRTTHKYYMEENPRAIRFLKSQSGRG